MTNYDRLSRLNHWSAAVLFMAMLGLGFFLTYGGLPPAEKLPLILKHKAVGVLLFGWAVWRVGYRIAQGFARPVEPLPNWQRVASKASHILLLTCLLLMPTTGLIMGFFSGIPTDVFGLFTVPALDKVDTVAGAARLAHKVVAYTFTVTLTLHIAAALKHHLVDRDRTLVRMIKGA